MFHGKTTALLCMKTLTYNLQDNDQSSASFYHDLDKFAGQVVAYPDRLLHQTATSMKLRSDQQAASQSRTEKEYFFELLMFGVLWNNYRFMALPAEGFRLHLLKRLYKVRKRYLWLKPSVDLLRGKLMASLKPKESPAPAQLNLKSYERLLLFLEACGDYWEEARRLREWQPLFGTLSDENEVWQHIEQFSEWFQQQAATSLGSYTTNINSFVERNAPFYSHREDRLLCLRTESEYHLNMVGAQIMNNALSSGFRDTQKKVVLLPTCMRNVPEASCKALNDDLVRECIGCNAGCNVGRVKRSLNNPLHTVFLIPHSSNFSRFLRKWQGQKDTALIGVACVPNLIMGGYEMQSLGISSQCVFLDYCGCQKHWSPTRPIATNLSLNRLHIILDQ